MFNAGPFYNPLIIKPEKLPVKDVLEWAQGIYIDLVVKFHSDKYHFQ